ncbi:MAG: RNA-binding cell elongation regulator Jag/EloR [Chloroflexota bacterium]
MVEITGKTVEEAIQAGLSQLNLTEADVDVEIVQEGSRGIFGFGAEEAVVKLTPKSDTTTIEADTASMDTATVSNKLPQAHENETEAEIPEEPQAEVLSNTVDESIPDTVQQRAKEVLETLLEKMSVPAEVVIRSGEDLVEEDEEPPLSLDIVGNDLGVLIGRRGETLRSLQFIVRQILSKEEGHWVPVIVDVESYLVRRRKSLKQLADRMAEKVISSNRKVTLEPMTGQERRIIHLQLRDHEDVYTQSIGEHERRKVVIYPRHP